MTDQSRPEENAGQPEAAGDRRNALLRLGLAVAAAYFAPTVLSIDRRARAQGPSCAKNPKNC
jgi:hypothetical protein